VGAVASGYCAHAEGTFTTASGDLSHAEGQVSVASGVNSHAEGGYTVASGLLSHAEGNNTVASGRISHAEGSFSVASGELSHAEGNYSMASGNVSHAEGSNAVASGNTSHAEGGSTVASGFSSHAEGFVTKALGDHSHAEGYYSIASGLNTHAEGNSTQALGSASHAEGAFTTIATEHSYSHIMGAYGQSLYPNSWHVANGTATAPGLAAVLEGVTGNLYIDGTVMSPAADYAEMFETVDGLPLEAGYFVTSDGDKIRVATEEDRYILGVTSARPSIVGGAYHLNWQGRYEVDEWGSVKYEDVEIPEEKDEQGNIIMKASTRKVAVVNPEYDASQTYTSRMDRPEWVAVGMLGKLLVRDDGTCVKNGFCRPNEDGIATASEEGYRVLKRTGANQILIVVK
jgi:hypothetical protein